jgi:hypothetical protein
MRKDEKESVMKAAQEAKETLEALAVKCYIDPDNHFTPGQKMKHWCVCSTLGHEDGPSAHSAHLLESRIFLIASSRGGG